MTTQLDFVSAAFHKMVADGLGELLERRHLYQSVTIDMAPYDQREEQIRKAIADKRPVTNESSAVYNRIIQFRSGPWAFSLEGVLPAILVPPQRKETPTPNWFNPPTVRVACTSCDGVAPPHNPGYLGLTTDSVFTYTSRQRGTQVFALPYQCQNCKCEPLFFLVRREGLKLTLVGRSQFPEVLIPDFIPKNQQKFYRNALIADQTAFTLAAALYLRCVIEQYFYQVVPEAEIKAIAGKPTGDELADLYAKTLPKGFPDSFPSLKKAYSDLSAIIHSGKENDETKKSFVAIRTAVDGHFKAIQLFREMPGQ